MIVEKKCSKCGEVKPTEEFGLNNRAKDGLNTWCKNCSNKNSKKYAENNKEKIKECNKKYKENNKEKIKASRKIYTEKNKEKIKEQRKKYYEENKNYRNKQSSEYSKNNVIKINKTVFILNTVSPELKPIIKTVIDIKNLKRDLRLNRKKIEKGEI